MHIFDNVLDNSTLEDYYQKIKIHYFNELSKGHDPLAWYPTRNINLFNDLIIYSIKNYLETKIRVKLDWFDAELQTWPVGSSSDLHVHNKGRIKTDYNSLLYLNDDFEGGEFFTETGIQIKPKKNRLTFFNGKEVLHGINKVNHNHRYTIIVWWKDTKFY